jgi:hypothetical protein
MNPQLVDITVQSMRLLLVQTPTMMVFYQQQNFEMPVFRTV